MDTRKSFRLDGITATLLNEIARHSFKCESEIIRKYVTDGTRKEAEMITEETDKVMGYINSLKQV